MPAAGLEFVTMGSGDPTCLPLCSTAGGLDPTELKLEHKSILDLTTTLGMECSGPDFLLVSSLVQSGVQSGGVAFNIDLRSESLTVGSYSSMALLRALAA